MHGAAFHRYAPAMPTSASSEPESRPRTTSGRDAYAAGRDLHVHQAVDPSARASSSRALGTLRIEIHGSWSVADFIKLLGHLEDGYKAAAALESLNGQQSTGSASYVSQSSGAEPTSASLSASDLLQTVTAFQLAGGLRLGSLQYGSPGYVEVIGALNPLKNVKDGITENREINRKRDETRRLDEREREQHTMQHQEAMARESRLSEKQQQNHAIEAARLRMEAETARFNAMNTLIDRLPRNQQSVAAAQLLQLLMGTTEAIANDARIDGAKMLEQAAPPEEGKQSVAKSDELLDW